MSIYQRTGEHVLLDNALFWEIRAGGQCCAWIRDRGYYRRWPCCNHELLVKREGFTYCPVHLGLSMQPDRLALQETLADEVRRLQNAKAWAARIACASLHVPRNDRERRLRDGALLYFSQETEHTFRVIDQPMLRQSYAYAKVDRSAPHGFNVGTVSGEPIHPRTSFPFVTTTEVTWYFSQRIPGNNGSYYDGARFESRSLDGFLLLASVKDPAQ